MSTDKTRRLTQIVEAFLFVSGKPLAMEALKAALEGLEDEEIKKAIKTLQDEYITSGRSFNIAEIAGGYQIVTDPQYAPWINRLFKKDEVKLSAPALETLAIIAYKQPLTRAEIERIRGVNVEGVLKALLEKDIVKIRGRKDAPGRPLTYGTTDKFLNRFGLKGLEHLPKLREFSENDLEYNNKTEGEGENAHIRPSA